MSRYTLTDTQEEMLDAIANIVREATQAYTRAFSPEPGVPNGGISVLLDSGMYDATFTPKQLDIFSADELAAKVLYALKNNKISSVKNSQTGKINY